MAPRPGLAGLPAHLPQLHRLLLHPRLNGGDEDDDEDEKDDEDEDGDEDELKVLMKVAHLDFDLTPLHEKT